MPRQYALEQRFLGGKVIQEPAFADTRGLCHGIEGQVCRSRLDHDSFCRIEQAVTRGTQGNGLAEIHTVTGAAWSCTRSIPWASARRETLPSGRFTGHPSIGIGWDRAFGVACPPARGTGSRAVALHAKLRHRRVSARGLRERQLLQCLVRRPLRRAAFEDCTRARGSHRATLTAPSFAAPGRGKAAAISRSQASSCCTLGIATYISGQTK